MKKALMTIHGFLTDIHDFGRLYEFMTPYDKVVACKIPGHNGTLDFRKFTVENTFNSVLSCYDELAKDHDVIDVVGFSMGAVLSAYLTTKRKVNKIVMLSAGNKYINLATPFLTLKFFVNFVLQTHAKATGTLKERLDNMHKALSPYRANSKEQNRLAMKRFYPYMTVDTFNTFSSITRTVNKEIETLSPIATPTLAFWGDLDELVPKSSMEYLKKHFSNMQTIRFDDVGHLLMYTHHDCEIIREILKFLTDGQIDREIPPRQDTKTVAK